MKNQIHIRTCIAVLEDGKILLVPHYSEDTDVIQWNLPGGSVEFGESIFKAAIREFLEETGFHAEIIKLMDVSEVIMAEEEWHSITVSFLGHIIGGKLKSEDNHPYGDKTLKWFDANEITNIFIHPKNTIEMVIKKKGNYF
jgi:8-oxo-dGTP diphosphatase